MVRAVKLGDHPGGSYLNPSQGVFIAGSVPAAAGPEIN